MVYNWMSIGLNAVLWVTQFELTTVNSALQALGQVTHIEDQYIIDIFINFMLSEEVSLYCGMDANQVSKEEGR